MIEGMKGKEEKDTECTRGLDWKGLWEGGWPPQHSQWMWQPSVDLLTQTPQLMNQTWFLEELRLYVSVLARTKQTSINILAFFLSQC